LIRIFTCLIVKLRTLGAIARFRVFALMSLLPLRIAHPEYNFATEHCHFTYFPRLNCDVRPSIRFSR
jgi:hypothetical protein